jgi:hypothetical protein
MHNAANLQESEAHSFSQFRLCEFWRISAVAIIRSLPDTPMERDRVVDKCCVTTLVASSERFAGRTPCKAMFGQGDPFGRCRLPGELHAPLSMIDVRFAQDLRKSDAVERNPQCRMRLS